MLKQGLESRQSSSGQSVHLDPYYSLLSALYKWYRNSFLSMTFVVGISFDIFKTGTTPGLAVERPFFH